MVKNKDKSTTEEGDGRRMLLSDSGEGQEMRRVDDWRVVDREYLTISSLDCSKGDYILHIIYK